MKLFPQNSKTKSISSIYIVIGLIAVIYLLALTPTVGEGRIFKNKLEGEFNAGKNAVAISALTNFEWDWVCYYEGGDISSLSKELSFTVPSGSAGLIHKYSPYYSGSLWFFKDQQLIKKIEYFSGGSRHIKVGDKTYNYMYRHAFIGNYCNENSDAVFVKKENPYKVIVFTKI